MKNILCHIAALCSTFFKFKIIFFTNINYNILMFMLFLIVDLYVNENLINLPKSALVLVKSSWGQKLTRKCLHTCNKIIMTRNLLYVMYDMWSDTISTNLMNKHLNTRHYITGFKGNKSQDSVVSNLQSTQ